MKTGINLKNLKIRVSLSKMRASLASAFFSGLEGILAAPIVLAALLSRAPAALAPVLVGSVAGLLLVPALVVAPLAMPIAGAAGRRHPRLKASRLRFAWPFVVPQGQGMEPTVDPRVLTGLAAALGAVLASVAIWGGHVNSSLLIALALLTAMSVGAVALMLLEVTKLTEAGVEEASGGGGLQAKPMPCPVNAVAGAIADPWRLGVVVSALKGAGFGSNDVMLWPADRATATEVRASRGLLGFLEFFRSIGDERDILRVYEQAVRDGQYIMSVQTHGHSEVERAASVLAAHGAHGIKHFGRWMTTDLAQAPKEAVGVADQEAPAAEALEAADVLRGLSAAELAEVFAIGQEVQAPEGTVLARQGEMGEKVYVLLQGQVQLTAASPRGEITIRIARPGESLPLAALLGSGRLITTARAMTDVKAVEVPCAAFWELCRRRPEIGMEVYRATADILGERYRNTLTRLVGTFEQSLREADVFANV